MASWKEFSLCMSILGLVVKAAVCYVPNDPSIEKALNAGKNYSDCEYFKETTLVFEKK